MNGQKRMKNYDEAFKKKAIDLVTIAGKKATVVERELGIYQGAISSWIASSRENSGTAKEDREENRRLLARLKEVEIENEILKKAMGYLAKSQQ